MIDRLLAATCILLAILWTLIGVTPFIVSLGKQREEFEKKYQEEEENEQ